MSLETLFWKLEPCSPLLDPESPSSWSLQDYDVEEPEFKAEAEDASTAVVPTRADLAQQLLDDIEEYVKKEETFSDWFEEKVDLPIFDDIQSVEPASPIPSLVSTILPMEVLQPNFLKPNQELSYVLGQGHLTPPQSPPAAEVPVFLVQSPTYITLQPTADFNTEPYLAPPTPDLAHEMAVVDEVVRGAAQQWEQWESSDSNSRSSEGTEDSDDPEWMPQDDSPKPAGRRSRQSRPYNVNDRRLRKKEQNKNAATRYRLKKKAEVSTIVEEERGLEEKNANLQTKFTDLQREITYLKGLMRDVFRAKGLVQ